jgi:predicted transcriptional regulator
MTQEQWMIALTVAVILLALFKVAPIIASSVKKKNITETDQEALRTIIADAVKELLNVSTIKDKDEFKSYCIKTVMKELNAKGINDFSEEEVTIVVNLILNTVDNKAAIAQKFQ